MVEPRLTVTEVRAVAGVRHAAAGAIGVEQLGEHAGDPGRGKRKRGGARRVVVGQQDGDGVRSGSRYVR